LRSGGNIFRPIVQVKNLRAFSPGVTFDDFVKFGIGFHGTVLVGEDIAVEVVEKREIAADMADGEVVGI